ncbi:N-myristoyl transferase [Pluteus cervinus]|uniref:N-myristoyl transferase n=1 Tax=Pluteus cervinus TaxID=181527 RepID=A0ACD3BEC4_9AGAR|nr:N-myristoyl transferase [Pluteus cervinus]
MSPSMSHGSQALDASNDKDITVVPESGSDNSGDEEIVSPQLQENQPSGSSSQKKKKKKKGKSQKQNNETDQAVPPAQAAESPSASTAAALQLALKFAESKLKSDQTPRDHKFWKTQPVPQPGEALAPEDGFIEPSRPSAEVRQDAFLLPTGFEWSVIDINDPAQNKEVYDLLSANYVEDDDASFRFQYTGEFLQWALMPPGYHKDWHLGVRISSSKKLISFISAVPVRLRVRQNTILASEVNFLCVHKKWRSKRLAPVLIKEVTRQCNLKGVFQAIYTAGVVIPTPISTCRYYHRSLNVAKLVDVKFTYVPRNMTLARMIRVHKVPSTTTLSIREMEEKDVDQVTELFEKYMRRFDLVPELSKEEVKHQFLSGMGRGEVGSNHRREGQVIWTYVVEDPESKRITDFFSYYSLPSTIIGNRKYPVLEAAYLFYYATSVAFDPEAEEDVLKMRVQSIIGDALIVAHKAGFDVFNALTLMDNVPVLHELKFGVGDGQLNFYLYNWRTAPMAGMEPVGNVSAGRGIGVVML